MWITQMFEPIIYEDMVKDHEKIKYELPFYGLIYDWNENIEKLLEWLKIEQIAGNLLITDGGISMYADKTMDYAIKFLNNDTELLFKLTWGGTF